MYANEFQFYFGNKAVFVGYIVPIDEMSSVSVNHRRLDLSAHMD
jgi:hypothetical protein